jgi:tRNA-splicing ligase RtcB
MSRTKAKKSVHYNELLNDLRDYGVIVRAGSVKGLVEEAPAAYKDIDEVVDVVHAAQIATKVAKLRPVAIVKG